VGNQAAAPPREKRRTRRIRKLDAGTPVTNLRHVGFRESDARRALETVVAGTSAPLSAEALLRQALLT
jgi:hypothetical protein